MNSMFGFTSKSIKIENSTLLTILAALIGLYLFFQIKHILMLFFLSFIIMVALNPLVKRFQNWGVRRSLGIMTTYLIVAIVIALFIGIVVPPLISQLINLITFIRTSSWFLAQLDGIQGDVSQLQDQLTGLQISIADVSSFFGSIQTPVLAVVSAVGSVFSNTFLVFSVFVMSYFLLIERPLLHTKLRWFTKDKEKIERAGHFFDTLEGELGGWVRGELILMLTIGVLTYIGLTLLNIPYAVPLALIAGLLELVPNIGPTIAAVPAIIIAATLHGQISALAVLGLALGVQLLENNIIVPRIMKESAAISPLMVILSILVGSQLAGVMGALLAVPLYITIRSWYTFYILPKFLD